LGSAQTSAGQLGSNWAKTGSMNVLVMNPGGFLKARPVCHLGKQEAAGHLRKQGRARYFSKQAAAHRFGKQGPCRHFDKQEPVCRLRRTLIYYRKNDNEQNKIVCRERFIQANLNKLLLILVTT
jgi:hypothetical protein